MAFSNEEKAKQCLAHISSVYLENQIKEKLLSLIDNCTTIPIYKYGFTGDWRKEPIWK